MHKSDGRADECPYFGTHGCTHPCAYCRADASAYSCSHARTNCGTNGRAYSCAHCSSYGSAH